jgi:signal transduction histidine kinase
LKAWPETYSGLFDGVCRIGYEAIRNAYTHSRGSYLEVSLNYERDLTLHVSTAAAWNRR